MGTKIGAGSSGENRPPFSDFNVAMFDIYQTENARVPQCPRGFSPTAASRLARRSQRYTNHRPSQGAVCHE